MILETNRLIIREYTPGDFDALYEILSDAETMKYYPKPYDENGVHRWINWCIDSYRQYGFGLWALELKETGTFIGDCGISMQNIDGEINFEYSSKPISATVLAKKINPCGPVRDTEVRIFGKTPTAVSLNGESVGFECFEGGISFVLPAEEHEKDDVRYKITY